MSDSNINVEYEYAPGEAGKTAYVTISDTKLTEMGYTPESGSEKQASIVYVLNSNGAIGDGVDSTIKATVVDLTNANAQATLLVDENGDQITSFGSSAIAEETIPDAVADGDPVDPWYNVYGQQVIFGSNVSLNAIDVNQINDAVLSRLGPVTQTTLSAVGSGADVDVSAYHNFTIHLVTTGATGTSEVNIEHSIDGTNYAVIATSDITADGTQEVSVTQHAYLYLRVTVTIHDGAAMITPIIYAGN